MEQGRNAGELTFTMETRVVSSNLLVLVRTLDEYLMVLICTYMDHTNDQLAICYICQNGQNGNNGHFFINVRNGQLIKNIVNIGVYQINSER